MTEAELKEYIKDIKSLENEIEDINSNIYTIKTENKPTPKQVVQAQKPKQIVQMPKQETEIPKKAVQIKPVEIKEAADTIMPRIRKGKTQILGFFDTNDDDLY